MEIKRGDIVRIKSDLTECDHGQQICYTGKGRRNGCPTVVREMVRMAGKKVKIVGTETMNHIRVRINGCYWSKEMFEPLEKEKEKGKYKIIITKDKEELVEVQRGKD